MRIVDALTARSHLSPAYDPASEEQRQARRERQAATHAQAIISMKEEVPRKGLGRHWIEDEQGNFWREFGGDPHYASDVHHYYARPDGHPIMLERADPQTAPNSSAGRPGSSSAASSGKPRLGSAANR